MSTGMGEAGRAFAVPPRQNPYGTAITLAFEALRAQPPTAEALVSLGVEQAGGMMRVRVLDRVLVIDLEHGSVLTERGTTVRQAWTLLALHYLQAGKVAPDAREVSLSYFDECRGYISVFQKRIIGRFLGTVGRTAEQFSARSEAVGGARLAGPGLAYRFAVLPCVWITLIRHEDDGEFGPDANVVYRADVEQMLPPEDRVVAVELLLDTLAGKPVDEG